MMLSSLASRSPQGAASSATSSAFKKQRASTREVLSHAFDGAPDAFNLSEHERALFTGASATYGELDFDGVSALVHALRLNEHSTFYDLGSGRGAAVLHVAIESSARRSIGIELSQRRHQVAERALRRVDGRVAGVADRTAFVCADLRAVPWHLDATAVYVANLLFPPCLDAAVCRRLAESGTIDRVATLKPLEGLPGAAHLAHVGRLRVPFSWAARGHLYVYERRRRRVDS